MNEPQGTTPKRRIRISGFDVIVSHKVPEGTLLLVPLRRQSETDEELAKRSVAIINIGKE
jgi:hypothetical protein